jgi:hypothetical protein
VLVELEQVVVIRIFCYTSYFALELCFCRKILYAIDPSRHLDPINAPEQVPTLQPRMQQLHD